MTIATGFLLRVIVGALAIPVATSFWLLLCTGLLALFLGFGKRRHELVLLDSGASSHRPILREYSPYLLDQMIGVGIANQPTFAEVSPLVDGLINDLTAACFAVAVAVLVHLNNPKS